MPVDLAAFVLAPIMQKWALFEQRVIDLGLRNLYWLPFETCTDNGIVDADIDADNGIVGEDNGIVEQQLWEWCLSMM